jgi:hypothetical protein
MAGIVTSGATEGPSAQFRHQERRKLRQIAHWDREFADRAGNPVIWEARLRTAKELEREADRLQEEAS